MSAEELTHQLQKLTLQESRLHAQLLETKTEIERVRQHITRTSAASTLPSTPPSGLNIGTRVVILSQISNTTGRTPQWNERERRATITGITRNTQSPYEVVRYQLQTDNGTRTWRKAKNVKPLQ